QQEVIAQQPSVAQRVSVSGIDSPALKFRHQLHPHLAERIRMELDPTDGILKYRHRVFQRALLSLECLEQPVDRAQKKLAPSERRLQQAHPVQGPLDTVTAQIKNRFDDLG